MQRVIGLSLLLAIVVNAVELNFRMIGGNIASQGQFPFMVLIKSFFNTSNEDFYCAGSLISHQWVMSAASCVYNVQYVDLYLGNVFAMEGISYRVQSDKFIIHEKFEPESRTNDICLILIPYTEYTESIRHIELPYSREKETFIGKKCRTLGWGRTKTAGPVSSFLQFLNLNVIKNDYCLQHGAEVRSTNLCIETTPTQSPCFGDFGGPLVYYNRRGMAVAIGITSYLTDASCESGSPAVYTRLTKYLLWLEYAQKI